MAPQSLVVVAVSAGCETATVSVHYTPQRDFERRQCLLHVEVPYPDESRELRPAVAAILELVARELYESQEF